MSEENPLFPADLEAQLSLSPSSVNVDQVTERHGSSLGVFPACSQLRVGREKSELLTPT